MAWESKNLYCTSNMFYRIASTHVAIIQDYFIFHWEKSTRQSFVVLSGCCPIDKVTNSSRDTKQVYSQVCDGHSNILHYYRT